MEPRFKKKNLTINAIFSDEVTIVNADPNKIKRVIQNLLDNAVKFSYHGGNIITEVQETDKKVLCECLHSDILKYAEIYVNKNDAFKRANLMQPYNLKDILNMIESGFTNEQIGKRFGVSKQKINQIIKKIKMILPKDYEKYLT